MKKTFDIKNNNDILKEKMNIIEILKNDSLSLAKIYGTKIKIEININPEITKAVINITEHQI